jgi:hypothetical protein
MIWLALVCDSTTYHNGFYSIKDRDAARVAILLRILNGLRLSVWPLAICWLSFPLKSALREYNPFHKIQFRVQIVLK